MFIIIIIVTTIIVMIIWKTPAARRQLQEVQSGKVGSRHRKALISTILILPCPILPNPTLS